MLRTFHCFARSQKWFEAFKLVICIFFEHIVVILHAFTYAFERKTFNCITLDSSRFHERKFVEENFNQYKIQHITDFS